MTVVLTPTSSDPVITFGAYPLSHPTTPGFKRAKFGFNTTVGFSESIFQGSHQVQEWQREFIDAAISLPELGTRARAEAWISFLMGLGGRSGTFLLGDPLGKNPRGIATGTPLVKGASQTGKVLLTDGWTPSTTGILRAGDWYQLGSGTTQRIYKLVGDADTDGSGNATLNFRPRLRETPADNAPLTLVNTKGVFRLAENRVEWDLDELMHVGLDFRAMEAL